MEEVARMAYISFSINPFTAMNPHLTARHFLRKHGAGAYYGQ
jgi:hypothetical protein